MFLIIFNTGHALLLSSLRILRPRSNRGERAEQTRNIVDLWPQAWPFHECGQAQCVARTHFVRVRELSTYVFSPCQQVRQRIVRIHGLASVSTVRKQASVQNTRYPQTVRNLELFTSTPSSLAGIVRAPRPAENCQRHRIAVSMSLPISFQVHIQTIPSYVLI